MYIRAFYIDGFGIFHNQSLEDIPNGLVLFVGENESGKTTLMEFIRTVFFGFPRRGSRNDYPPLRGGNQGGSLEVVMQDGRRFIIERSRRHVAIMEEGKTPEQVEPSGQLMGGIDRQTFERIFAIGLEELKGLDVLSQENVRGRLLAASTGLGAASLPSAMKRLDSELDNLLKRSGSAPVINKLVNRLKDIESQISGLKGQSFEYAECQRRQKELEKQIKQCKTSAENIRQRLRQIGQLMQAREPWVQLCAAREKAIALEFAKKFPSNGLLRFEELKSQVEEFKAKKQKLEDKKELLDRQLSELTVDEALIKHQRTIEALTGEREKLVSALDELPSVKSKMEQAAEEFQKRLLELGMEWDSERLAQTDTSVQVRQHVQEIGRQLNAGERKYEQAQTYQRTNQDAAVDLKRVADEAQRRLDMLPRPPIMDSQKLQQQLGAARAVRSLFHEKDVTTINLDSKRKALQERSMRLESLRRQEETIPLVLPAWLPIVFLLGGLGLVVSLISQRSYVFGAVVSCAVIALVGGLYWLRNRQMNIEISRQTQIKMEKEQVEGTQQTTSEEIKVLEQRLGALDAEIDRVASESGLDRLTGGAYAEQLVHERERATEQLRDWMTYEREKNDAETHWRNASVRLEQATQDTENARMEVERLRDEWKRWLKERRFVDTIRPEGFEAVVRAVESARVTEQNLLESRHRVNQMEVYISQTRIRLGTLLKACGRRPFSDEMGVEDLDALRHELDAALLAQRNWKELKSQLEETRSEAERLSEQLEESQAEYNMLMQQTEAKNEDEFRYVAESYDKWSTCQQVIETNELMLRTIAGTSEAQVALETELGRTESLRLQAEKDQVGGQLNEITDSVSEFEREVGGVNERLNQMNQDEKLGELLLEQRSLREQLSDATRCWVTLVVCRNLLKQASEVYERERQPQVIQQASNFLNAITKSRYRLLSPFGEESVQLEDTVHKRKREVEWSGGLADQVYFSIRLGLAREFGRHAEPLPVVLDDVLLKFDPTRQQSAVKVMLEFAREQQVLLFSCYPEFQELIKEAHGNVQSQDVVIASYNVSDGAIDRCW